MQARIAVVGSVNLDLVAHGPRLPRPGETVTGAVFAAHPGGKGGNQALAARRLGAAVDLYAQVGCDARADEALGLLAADGVDLERCIRIADAPTGVALIVVDAGGENQIVVAPGANARSFSGELELAAYGAVICQLEIPIETLLRASGATGGLFCLNLAPARPVPDALLHRADLVVVNETEHAFYGSALASCARLAVTLGARGAVLYERGAMRAQTAPPPVRVVDTTGAGDAFVAALTLASLEGRAPEAALHFACCAGALATTRPGAQPALPWRRDVDHLHHPQP